MLGGIKNQLTDFSILTIVRRQILDEDKGEMKLTLEDALASLNLKSRRL